jgi:uncharacterized protein YacL
MERLETSAENDPWWKKLLFLTLVILTLYGILGTVGFFLWFVFPVQQIHGLNYLQIPHLIFYYILINILDIIGVILFARIIYYRRIKTSNPIKDGIILGCYTIGFSWLIDIIVYIFIRNTLPTIHEYFLGKNQPEIGIAWLIGFVAAILAGWLETQRRVLPHRRYRLNILKSSSLLIVVSIILTIIGISFFDVRP